MFIRNGYLVTTRNAGRGRCLKESQSAKRDWWFVKHYGTGAGFHLSGGSVFVPKELIGKKVMLKLEVMQEAD